MKIADNRSKFLKTTFGLGIFLCIVALVAITFAGYSVYWKGEGGVSFDKIAIRANSSMQVSSDAQIIAGSEIVDGSVGFSKTVDSRPIYVRGTLEFSLKQSGTAEQNAVMNQYLQDFNNAEFEVYTGAQNGATWVYNNGYYYLVEASNTSRCKNVIDNFHYTLFDSVVMPTSIKQHTDNVSLLLPVTVRIKIEAVQSEGTPYAFNDIVEVFNDTFGS